MQRRSLRGHATHSRFGFDGPGRASRASSLDSTQNVFESVETCSGDAPSATSAAECLGVLVVERPFRAPDLVMGSVRGGSGQRIGGRAARDGVAPIRDVFRRLRPPRAGARSSRNHPEIRLICAGRGPICAGNFGLPRGDVLAADGRLTDLCHCDGRLRRDTPRLASGSYGCKSGPRRAPRTSLRSSLPLLRARGRKVAAAAVTATPPSPMSAPTTLPTQQTSRGSPATRSRC